MPTGTSTTSRGLAASHTPTSLHPDTGSTDRARDELLAATAHELRLPLSHIKGFVSSLRRTDMHWDEATRRDFLAEIEIETDRLADLVDALIQASGANGARSCIPTRVPITATALIEDGLHRVRCPLRNRRVSVTVPAGLPALCVDPDGIGRVLANLLQNAVKYSPQTSAIWISARLIGHSSLEFSVQDEGSGVAVKDRQRIFEPFFRTRTSVLGNSPGHGLGLAICKSIVLGHGGSINVDERPGGGASFTVVLPVALRAGRLGDGRRNEEGGHQALRSAGAGLARVPQA
jgi:two-component system sensor histidine kinase KdpD